MQKVCLFSPELRSAPILQSARDVVAERHRRADGMFKNKIIAITLSFSLIFAGMPAVRADNFLAVPGVRESSRPYIEDVLADLPVPKVDKKLPKKSIYNIFALLCNNKITEPMYAYIIQASAGTYGRKLKFKDDWRFAYKKLTIELALNVLKRLRLVEGDDYPDPGHRKYFVPHRIRRRSHEIGNILRLFFNKRKTFDIELVDQLYEFVIRPLLEGEFMPDARMDFNIKPQAQTAFRHNSVVLPGFPPVYDGFVNSFIRQFMRGRKDKRAHIIKFKIETKNISEDGYEPKKFETFEIYARDENKWDDTLSSYDNPMEGVNKKLISPIENLIKARKKALVLEHTPDMFAHFNKKETIESVLDELRGLELAVVPGHCILDTWQNNGVVTYVNKEFDKKRMFIGSELIRKLSEEDLILLLIESARYAAKPYVLEYRDIKHDNNLLQRIAKITGDDEYADKKPREEKMPSDSVCKMLRLLEEKKDRVPLYPAGEESNVFDEKSKGLDLIDNALHRFYQLKGKGDEYAYEHIVEDMDRGIRDSRDPSSLGVAPQIGLERANKIADMLITYFYTLNKPANYQMNIFWLLNTKEPIDPGLMKKLVDISLHFIKGAKSFDDMDVYGAGMALKNLGGILENYHDVLDMPTIEKILTVCIKDANKHHVLGGSVVSNQTPAAISKLIGAQKYFSKKFMDFLIKEWNGCLKKADLEDCFKEIIESNVKLTEDQLKTIQNKLLEKIDKNEFSFANLQYWVSSLRYGAVDDLKILCTLGGLLKSKRRLVNEKEFLKNVVRIMKNKIKNCERGKNGFVVHYVSFIAGLLGGDRELTKQDREYFENYLWKIWSKTGSYVWHDATFVDALMPYCYGLQGKTTKDVSFGKAAFKKRMGSHWRTAFAITTDAFNKLDLTGFAIGSQSLVKIELLKEALKKGLISSEFLTRINNELIPTLRIIEKLSDQYPAIGIETKKPINSNKDYDTSAWHVAIMNYLSDVQIPTALGKSYQENDKVELRIPPTVYPVFRRLMKEIKELLFIEPTMYHTSVTGDYGDESRFLLSSFFYSATPPGSSFPVNPEEDSFVEWAFPGFNMRYIGATVDPWTGKLLTIYDKKSRGTQTNFFHTAIEVGMPDGSTISFYEEDLRRVFFLTTAAAAFRGLYEINDPVLKEQYRAFKADILNFYINHLFISEDDLLIILKSSPGRDYSYSDAEHEMYHVLRRLYRGFIRNEDDTPREIRRKNALHKQFQEIIAKHVDIIDNHIFPAEIGASVAMMIQGIALGDVFEKVRSAGFSTDSRASAMALQALKRADDSHFEEIHRAVLKSQ